MKETSEGEVRMQVNLQYGALADPLEDQLNKQGLTLSEKREFIEKLQHALTMCRFHLLTDSQHTACLNKFHKKVMKEIKPLES